MNNLPAIKVSGSRYSEAGAVEQIAFIFVALSPACCKVGGEKKASITLAVLDNRWGLSDENTVDLFSLSPGSIQ